MNVYSVDLIQKEWFTVEVAANSEDEAKQVVLDMLTYSDGTRVGEAWEATARLYDETPETLGEDFWERCAEETGYIEHEIGRVEVVMRYVGRKADERQG